MTERQYQLGARAALLQLFDEVDIQWRPFLRHGHQMYSPAIDIAVGPFATEHRYGLRYAELLEETRPFIERLIAAHNDNVEDQEERASFNAIANFNENARCFIGIEIENSGSKKHCIGDLVNASALGRVGILVAWSDRVLRTFLRQRVYLKYLADAGKNTFKTDNALVLTVPQFDACLRVLRR